MQDTPVGADDCKRHQGLHASPVTLGRIQRRTHSRALAGRWDLDLPLDEPTNAARRTSRLPGGRASRIQKWVRPGDLVRVSQGPTPQ